MSGTWQRVPPSWSTEIATSSELNKMARGVIARAFMDSSQTGIGGETNVSDLVCPFSLVDNNRLIRISLNAHVKVETAATTNVEAIWKLKNGATTLITVRQIIAVNGKDDAVSFSKCVSGFNIGSYTITPTLQVNGLYTVAVSCASSQPAELTVEDVGPDS